MKNGSETMVTGNSRRKWANEAERSRSRRAYQRAWRNNKRAKEQLRIAAHAEAEHLAAMDAYWEAQDRHYRALNEWEEQKCAS